MATRNARRLTANDLPWSGVCRELQAVVSPKGNLVPPKPLAAHFELEPGRPSYVPNLSHSADACSSFVCGVS